MSDSTLCLMPISDLLKKRFLIPAYQRGYRWKSRQVTDLLDDIASFHHDSADKGRDSFYCLQPIVVQKHRSADQQAAIDQVQPIPEWEVIDGQQRLTTIYLILTYLKDGMKLLRKELYSLRYDTREDSETFLQHLDDPSTLLRGDENIDYFHICSACKTIEEWFKGKEDYELALLQRLVSGSDIGKNVQVIWYELSEKEDPVDVFIRLNMGKIQLTNAELIRALLLRTSQFQGNNEGQKLQIAQEWDGIEKVLQSDDFWYFIYEGEKVYDTRIEYLFWLIVSEFPFTDINQEDHSYTFIAYQRLFMNAEGNSLDKWLTVKQHFMTCEEWYRDRTLYHLIGYLIADGVPILTIMKEYKGKTKHAFRQALRKMIYEKLFDVPYIGLNENELNTMIRESFNDLDYDDDGKKIRSVLLLFNIAILLQNKISKARFPFDSYKTDDWDIEHIRSVASNIPDRDYLQKEWLQNVQDYWSETDGQEAARTDQLELQELRKDVDSALINYPFQGDIFDQLYKRILAYFHEDVESEVDNSLGNLALLDAGTNRSYKNAVFPIKRRRILGLDKEGTFVPLGTTNVFLKYYSKKIDNMMFWGDPDRGDYLDSIIATLVKFFSPKEGRLV
jgi:Protein of unknown function DUF262